jgi:hypothetical protein
MNLAVLSLHLGLELGGHLVPRLLGHLGDDVGLVLGSESLLRSDGLDSLLVVMDVLLP